jgi:hypothetical protein
MEVIRQVLLLTESLKFLTGGFGRILVTTLVNNLTILNLTRGRLSSGGSIPEESLWFRSSFNFVRRTSPLDTDLIDELRSCGFECRDAGQDMMENPFRSKASFNTSRADKWLSEEIQCFDLGLCHQPNPEDASFGIRSSFDTDPYEPMPGGCMSIWPYSIGHFIEPYTLVQDLLWGWFYQKWRWFLAAKADFIQHYHGMALLNSHPEFLINPKIWRIYAEFLNCVKGEGGIECASSRA